jgi:3-phenylpropionate/trans-cinnamate dioxygenase ferredoxin reductase component
MPAGVVIIGGGQAGLETAAALRTQGFDGPVTLIGEEPHAPYQRPPLSKEYLLGKQNADSLPLRAAQFYEKHNILLLTGEKVLAIDRAQRQLKLASGKSIAFEKLILAVGARNRILLVKGAERALYLRTRDEADAIRDHIASAQTVVVIGGGFIGLEVAAAARMMGKQVTVIEAAQRLMARAVAPVLSDFFRDLHQSEGVEILLGASIQEITPNAVRLDDGTQRAADVVLAGIGVVPNIELAQAAGLRVENGIVVDEYMHTNDPDIYAIGDCAIHPNPFAGALDGDRVRLESVQNAVDQAKCVARGIIGSPSPYRDVPWFWTDQFAVRFQMVGLSNGYDETAMRGTIEGRKFSVFYFKNGRLIGVDSVNRFGDHIAARKILAAGTAITPQQAADETVDLKKLE